LDDGADLIYRAHSQFKDLAQGIIGGTEETTTGVHRLRAMADAGELLYPVIAVNDAETKWDFDNVHGTGQSTIDGILRATSVLLAGKNFVIAGYGHCGKGLAMRARGMGANVIITEIDPIPALKATMDGFRVMKMDEAASIGDLFCTATGMKDVIVGRHYDSMKDGAIVCNTGHYDCEVSISDLEERATEIFTIRDNNEAFSMPDGRRIHLLARGRLVNLASAEGHPSEVMDMSFANQFLALCRLAREGSTYDNSVYDIHPDQDRQLAALKLSSSGIVIDELTEDQKAYLHDFSVGT
jgi:adenosylhomocysteinase